MITKHECLESRLHVRFLKTFTFTCTLHSHSYALPYETWQFLIYRYKLVNSYYWSQVVFFKQGKEFSKLLKQSQMSSYTIYHCYYKELTRSQSNPRKRRKFRCIKSTNCKYVVVSSVLEWHYIGQTDLGHDQPCFKTNLAGAEGGQCWSFWNPCCLTLGSNYVNMGPYQSTDLLPMCIQSHLQNLLTKTCISFYSSNSPTPARVNRQEREQHAISLASAELDN